MKKILLASTMLAGFAGAAFAESHESAPAVSLSGDGRMGIIKNFGSDDAIFTSRARVKFTLSGESDGGLQFGGDFRAHNAADAASGTAGSVYVSGSFGKLSMGDVDGAALAAVGHVDGVGLTGLGDLNEISYLSGSDSDPSALYEYSTGNLTFYVSASQRGVIAAYGSVAPTETGAAAEVVSVGAKYATDAFSVSLGYEDADQLKFEVGGGFSEVHANHVVVGASTTFSNVTLKAVYGTTGGDLDGSQTAVSATYAMDALSATAFWADDTESGVDGGSEAYGLGASYDLGGGLSVVGGWVKDKTADDDAFDLGVKMSF